MADRALTRHRAIVARHRIQTANVLGRSWMNLGSWDESDVARYATLVSPTLTGAKSATVSATSAYLAHVLGLPPAGLDPSDVPVDVDLRLPFTATWHARSIGRADAVTVGRSAAQALGESFVQSTARRTGDAFQAATGVPIHWRRVAEPGACPWCSSHDGTRYSRAADGDFGHDRCHCDVVPS